MSFIDLTGKRFNKLTVVRRADHLDKHGWKTKWDVVCDCGNTKTIGGRVLRRGTAKSCGCEHNAWFRIRPYESLYNRFLTSAQDVASRKGLGEGNTISYEEFTEYPKHPFCHYCDKEVSFAKFGGRVTKYNLDRKDSLQGYSVDNCVVCCRDCNFGKGNRYSYEEWKVMVKALLTFRNTKKGETYGKEKEPPSKHCQTQCSTGSHERRQSRAL